MAETLRCAHCGGDNPADAQFCIDCGKPLTSPTTGPTTRLAGIACPGCRTNNPENARFCVVCGRSLRASATPQQHVPAPHPVRPTQPPRPTPQQSYPRVHTPPPLIQARPVAPPLRRTRPHGPDAGAIVFVVGLLLLLANDIIWPGILLLIGISLMVSHMSRGHPEKGLTSLIWLGGLALVIGSGMFWPGIIILLIFTRVAGLWGQGRHW